MVDGVTIQREEAREKERRRGGRRGGREEKRRVGEGRED